MAKVRKIPRKSRPELVETPIVDMLVADSARRVWVISFVPDESVSKQEKEQTVVPINSADGKRIQLRMDRLAKLLGNQVERIVHGGGANFTFLLLDGRFKEISEQNGKDGLAIRAYAELTDIAMTAQLAFQARRMPAAG